MGLSNLTTFIKICMIFAPPPPRFFRMQAACSYGVDDTPTQHLLPSL